MLKKCRQTFGAPRAGFAQSLKKKIEDRFVQNEDFFGDSLPSLLPISPAKHFRHRLRDELLEADTLHRPENFFWRISQKHPFSFRFLRGFASVAVSFTIFFSAVFFGVSPQSQASDNTFITAFTGDVFVSLHGEEEVLLPSEMSIGEETTIRTGQYSGATIRFFEDSVLRLDADTTITIDALDPHPLQNDLGEVRVVLHSGRVWIKTFSLDEEYSKFHLVLPNNRIILDSGGAIDAFVSNSSESVRSWDRLVRIRDNEGGGFVLSGGRQFVQRVKSVTISLIPESEAESEWVLSNQTWDETISTFFVEEKIKRKRGEAVSALEKLKETFVSPFSDSAEKELLELEMVFFDSLENMSVRFDESDQDFMEEFREKARALFEKHPDDVRVFFASAEKTLHSVLPDSPLFPAKETIESLQKEFAEAEDKTILAEKQKTRRLWEAATLADAGQTALAEEIVRNTSDSQGGSSLDATSELLDERQEQIAALGKMEENDAMGDVVGIIENNLIEETSALVRPGFPTGKRKTFTEQAYDIIGRMKKYESEQGRRNSLHSQLRNIDTTAENIPLLMEVKERLPDELKNEVDQKILNIMEEESVRAKDQTLFSIEK